MRHIIIIAFITSVLFNCSQQNPVSGTADDVNNGSLFGQLLTDGKKTDDTVMVYLYVSNTSGGLAKIQTAEKEPVRSMKSCNGSYEFDSLPPGDYRIEVTKDSIAVGETRGIKLVRNERKEINITIVIIINQTFNIWTDQSQNITINNFYIDNGKVEKADTGYVLAVTETDTALLKIEITVNGTPRIIDVQVIRQQDGRLEFQAINGSTDMIIENSTPEKPASLDELIGTWRGYELGGEDDWWVIFKKDTNTARLTCYSPDGTEFYNSRIVEIDKGKLPYFFKTIIDQCISFKQYQGKAANCIYKIEHDTLYWGGSEPGSDKRPLSFTEDGVRCFVMTRTDSTPMNNKPPYFITSADSLADTVQVGDTYIAKLAYYDSEGDRLTLTCAMPSGSKQLTDSIIWIPGVNQLGNNDFIAMIHDSIGRGDTLIWKVVVTKPADSTLDAPNLLSPGNDTIINSKELLFSWGKIEGSAITYDFYLGVKLALDSVSVKGLTTANILFDSDTLKAGTYYWKVIARKGTLKAESEIRTFILNHPPIFLSTADSLRDAVNGAVYRDTIIVFDRDSDPISYKILESPEGLLLDSNRVYWYSTLSNVGNKKVTVQCADTYGGCDTLTWYIRVSNRDIWDTTHAKIPTARSLPGGTVFDGNLYIFGGGDNSNQVINAAEAYSPQQNTWSTLAPMPTKRDGMAVEPYLGMIAVLGGYRNQPVGECALYDPQTNTWPTNFNMPISRSSFGWAVTNGSLFLFGGLDSTVSDSLHICKKVEKINLSSGAIDTVAPMPTPRAFLSTIQLNGKVYAIGGVANGRKAGGEVEIFDLNTGAWSKGAPMPTPRLTMAVAVSNGKIYTIGGSQVSMPAVRTVEVYDPTTDTWQSAAPLPVARSGAIAGYIDGRIYVAGGANGNILLGAVVSYLP
jgi:hypothetical protein